MQGILGKKLGMTQIYEEDGTAVPVTVVKAGPCLVVQRKSADGDGYRAVQIGLVEERTPRKLSKPMKGHFEKAGVAPMRRLKRVPPSRRGSSAPATRSRLDLRRRRVRRRRRDQQGQGVPGRDQAPRLRRRRATTARCSTARRARSARPSFPSRVYPGMRLPGQTGGKRVTVKNLKVVQVDEESATSSTAARCRADRNGLLAIRRSAKKGGS
jgi:large subunit ribosomal protein L3